MDSTTVVGSGGLSQAMMFLVGVLVCAALLALYLAPWLTAVVRKRHNQTAIFLLNLLLGWTLLGWVIALIWAVTSPAPPVIVVQGASITNMALDGSCSECGTLSPSGAMYCRNCGTRLVPAP